MMLFFLIVYLRTAYFYSYDNIAGGFYWWRFINSLLMSFVIIDGGQFIVIHYTIAIVFSNYETNSLTICTLIN